MHWVCVFEDGASGRRRVPGEQDEDEGLAGPHPLTDRTSRYYALRDSADMGSRLSVRYDMVGEALGGFPGTMIPSQATRLSSKLASSARRGFGDDADARTRW